MDRPALTSRACAATQATAPAQAAAEGEACCNHGSCSKTLAGVGAQERPDSLDRAPMRTAAVGTVLLRAPEVCRQSNLTRCLACLRRWLSGAASVCLLRQQQGQLGGLHCISCMAS